MTIQQTLLRRAIAAHSKLAAGNNQVCVQPSNLRDVETVGDRSYVVLRNVRGILAAYRVRKSDSVLKRLKRWPTSLAQV